MDNNIGFLDADNVAGTSLLSLVARGSAIIAEMLRLSDNIPEVFLGSPGNPQDAARYEPILLDFRYLKTAEKFDEKIDSDADLVDLDEEFCENHMALLERFYKMFESVYKFINDFKLYIEEMLDGTFVQHTIDGVLLDVEGRQLMCEALYLYGCMLLIMDRRIPGIVRERMIISYYRYKGSVVISNIDEVVRLCRMTGFTLEGKRPKDYPEEYFSRFTIDKDVIEMIIGRLRSDDIYNHTSAFPNPVHRSTALSTQSAMLYVILYFAPNLLHNSASVMREIVDKYFNDNWMCAMYMGFVVDLADAWEPYKAARAALKNTLAKECVVDHLKRHQELCPQLNVSLEKYLTKGVLTDDFLTENLRKVMDLIRNCNVTLRWIILHRATSHDDKLRKQIKEAVPQNELVKLTMSASQLEFIIKGMLKTLLETKETRWDEYKTESATMVSELSDYFSGEKQLVRVKKNENLQSWFKSISDEIKSLDYMQPVLAGRKIGQLIHGLTEVQEYHDIDTNLQVKQFLGDVQGYMTKMIRVVNVSHKLVADLDVITDFSFAKILIASYTPLFHAKIADDPSLCLLLRAMFIKLSSILSLPLVRITQAESKDDVSVAEYFSAELVKYVRSVLEVVPISVFKILDSITHLQTNELKQLPTKLERKYLQDYAQLPLRYNLAKLTNSVSVFTMGVLNMKTTLLGIIKLDPKQTLEDGIRKQLVRQISSAMHEYLDFRTGRVEEFEQRIQQLGNKLDGFRQSFEYIQDYINVFGLRIWQEEFSRIINYNVEQECNSFLKIKVYDFQSVFQSDAIPIPQFERSKHPGMKDCVNFMGRIVYEVTRQTDPKSTVYIEPRQGWYDKDSREVVGIRTFSMLHLGLGIFGLSGMDRLLCFMIVRDLTAFVKVYRKVMSKAVLDFVQRISDELHPTTQFPPTAGSIYAHALSKTQKLWPLFTEFVSKIGQAQLIRRQISNELNFTAKLDSKLLTSSVEALNDALVNDVKAHYDNPDSKPYPPGEVLADTSRYVESVGLANPITKIYITTEPLPGLPLLLFLFVLNTVSAMAWSPSLSTMISTDKKQTLDGAPFVVGVITILKQFHSSHTHTFLNYLGQFIRASIGTHTSKASLPPDVINVLHFLEELCKFSAVSRKMIDAIVPSYIFDAFKH